MNKSGRILSIVVLVFAIAATTVSVILALRRNEFRGRADKESATIAAMVKSMEGEGKTSATGLDKVITFTPADPTTKTPEMGSLGWTTYHAQKGQTEPYYVEFDATLKKAKDMAAALQKQRDYLADRLAEVAKILGMPEDQFKASELKGLTDAWKEGGKDGTAFTYKKNGQNIVTYATNVNTRDQAMIESLAKAAEAIKHPLDKKNLLERQVGADGTPSEFGHAAVLEDFNKRVDALYVRATAYAETITQGMDKVSNHNMTWTANKDAVKSETEYEGAMSSLLTDYATLQTQLELLDSTRDQLKQTIKELEATTAQLNKTTAERDSLKDEKTKLAAEVAKLKKRIIELVGDLDSEAFAPKADLHGKILQVNNEFGFVVINLGRKQIREPWMLLVSRGEGKDAKLVARIQVSRSFQKYCIAEILDVPSVDANRNPIRVGDDVYLAKP